MKTGLVLEGGGMRGLFSVGFIDVLMENGIYLDGLIGVSAGALFGCNYKSHQIGRGLRYNLRFKNDPRYMGWKSLLRTGNFINTDFAYNVLPRTLDVFDFDTFEQEPMQFYVVCTDIVGGKPVYKLIDKADEAMFDWLRASGSMPLMAEPVEIEGYTLLDGGITDSIPLKFAQSAGFVRNIVVLTQPEGYRKKPFTAPWIFRMLRKYPKVEEMMRHRSEMYNEEIDYVYGEAERTSDTLLVMPDEPLAIGRIERDGVKMRRCYEMGRKKGMEMLDDVRRFAER